MFLVLKFIPLVISINMHKVRSPHIIEEWEDEKNLRPNDACATLANRLVNSMLIRYKV
jgi:hypothetical protein